MNKTFLLLLLACISYCAKAQYIQPADLLQMNRLWQSTDPHADLLTYQYLRTVDSSWYPRSKPTIDEHGYTSIIGYTRDHKSWFKPFEEQVTLTVERGTLKRAIIYTFTEADTWNSYLAQMTKMQAEKLGAGASQGGYQTIYQVNDIAFILIEFPPGTNGVDKTYQVCVTPASN